MAAQTFHIGDHVRARHTIFKVPLDTRGTITQCFASLWGLYEVQFESSVEPRVVWVEDLEADGLAGVHDQERGESDASTAIPSAD